MQELMSDIIILAEPKPRSDETARFTFKTFSRFNIQLLGY